MLPGIANNRFGMVLDVASQIVLTASNSVIPSLGPISDSGLMRVDIEMLSCMEINQFGMVLDVASQNVLTASNFVILITN